MLLVLLLVLLGFLHLLLLLLAHGVAHPVRPHANAPFALAFGPRAVHPYRPVRLRLRLRLRLGLGLSLGLRPTLPMRAAGRWWRRATAAIDAAIAAAIAAAAAAVTDAAIRAAASSVGGQPRVLGGWLTVPVAPRVSVEAIHERIVRGPEGALRPRSRARCARYARRRVAIGAGGAVEAGVVFGAVGYRG